MSYWESIVSLIISNFIPPPLPPPYLVSSSWDNFVENSQKFLPHQRPQQKKITFRENAEPKKVNRIYFHHTFTHTTNRNENYCVSVYWAAFLFGDIPQKIIYRLFPCKYDHRWPKCSNMINMWSSVQIMLLAITISVILISPKWL